MTSKRQHLNFDPNFVFSAIEEWKTEADKYDQMAQRHYNRIRSYLTLFQFRLNDQQKCDIREKLAQSLDEINANDFVHDLDSYLEGFCFKLDKSVIQTQPKEVKIEIAQPRTETTPKTQHYSPATQSNQNFSDPLCSETIDCNDLDYYTMQFFQ